MLFSVRDIDTLRLVCWGQYVMPDRLLSVISETELQNLISLGLIKCHEKSGAAVLTAKGASFLQGVFRSGVPVLAQSYHSAAIQRRLRQSMLALTMEKVDTFEEFIGLLSGLNQKEAPLMVNSFYIIDDEKQRGKMTEEFYAAVRKQIAEYQERADYFIQSGCQSPAVLERWALKIQGLEERKRHYEQVLRRELDGLDDEFGTLKFMGQELQNRAKDIRFQKAA